MSRSPSALPPKGRVLALFSGLFVLVLLLFPNTAFAFAVPPPHGAVTDTTNVLSHEDDVFLEARLKEYRERTGNQIGVLVVPSTGSDAIRDAAFQTFNTWGVGAKDLDNGVLVMIATMDHRTRIEVGKGIEHTLTDALAAKILEEHLAPHLRAGDFREGIDAAILAIEDVLDGRGIAGPSPSTQKAAPPITSTSSRTTEVTTSDDTNTSPRLWVFLMVPLMGAVWLVGLIIQMRGIGLGGPGGGSSDNDGSSWDTSSMHHHDGGGHSSDFGGGSSHGGGADGSF